MKRNALIILSDGFEDIEAVAPLDVLTRAGVQVTIAGLRSGPVSGAYGLSLNPHTTIDQISSVYDALIFPGGRKNAQSLAASTTVLELIAAHNQAGKIVAAICASPSHILAEAAGILRGKRATGDPNFNDKLEESGAIVTGEAVTCDGNIVTSVGPGTALLFGLKLAELLSGKDAALELSSKWRL